MTASTGDSLSPGKKHSVSVSVDHTNTATAVHSGGLEVFATPAMIALMERAAFECAQGGLGIGQTTVGSMVSIEHLAASPVGARITATAIIEAVEGRKISFKISACDGHGEIGTGRHTRAVVDIDRFMSKAQDRK